MSKLIKSKITIIAVLKLFFTQSALLAKTHHLVLPKAELKLVSALRFDADFPGLIYEVSCQSLKISIGGTLEDIKIGASDICKTFKISHPNFYSRTQTYGEFRLSPNTDGSFTLPQTNILFEDSVFRPAIICIALRAPVVNVIEDSQTMVNIGIYCNRRSLPEWWDHERDYDHVDGEFSALPGAIDNYLFQLSSDIRLENQILVERIPKP